MFESPTFSEMRCAIPHSRQPTDSMQLCSLTPVLTRTVICGASLALVACSDVVDPVSALPPRIASHVALASMVAQSVALSTQVSRPNEVAWRIASQRFPGFAGTELDDSGNLVVLLSGGLDDAAAARSAALELLRQTGRPLLRVDGHPLGVSVREVAHSYTELARWRDEMLVPVLDGARASSLDLDESKNAVTIGVRDAAIARDVESVLAALKVPRTAYRVEIGDVAIEVADLEARGRPLMGGVKFGFLTSSSVPTWCTLGIPVLRSGVRGFLSASHCSTIRNTPDYGTAWQPWYNGPAIGSEVFDRVGSSCGWFNSLNCRHADVAMYGLQTLDSLPGEAGFAVGRIARTAAPTPGIHDGYGSVAVVGSWDVAGMLSYPIMNETLHKIGNTTGWTYGKVYKTCVTKDIPGHRYWCQDFVEVNAEPGDSGSPVFRLYASSITGEPYATAFFMGILWGADAATGPAHSGGIFGNVSQLLLELGNFQVVP